MQYFLYTLAVVFFILSRTIPPHQLMGELGLNEIYQHLILLITCILIFKNKRILTRRYNHATINFKLFFLLILLYEEISFITKGLIPFFSNFNHSSSVNIHNSNFLYEPIFKKFFLANYPFFDDISIFIFLYILFSLLISYGNFFKRLKNLEFLFLEKKFSTFGMIFIINHYLSSLFNKLDIMNIQFFQAELVESYLYTVIAIDLLEKLSKSKKLNQKIIR